MSGRRVKFSRSKFIPENSKKYIGTYPIVCRSSWERVLCDLFDKHPNVYQWASESIKIPYVNPMTGKSTIYIPDFLVRYIDKNGSQHTELIEVKPMNQTLSEKARGIKNRVALAINKAKWSAANKWAKKNGMTFRVVTEKDLFLQASGQKKGK